MRHWVLNELAERKILRVDSEVESKYITSGLGYQPVKVNELFMVIAVNQNYIGGNDRNVISIDAYRSRDGERFTLNQDDIVRIDGMTEQNLVEAFRLQM